MEKAYNTYINISLFSWKEGSFGHNAGRIYVSNEHAKLDLHLDVDYATAKRELARLMVRTGKLPEVIGRDDPDMVMYSLSAFLD